MRVFWTCLIVALATILPCAPAHAQANNLDEPGSLLVCPLLDNIECSTYISLSNHADADVWLYAFVVVHPPFAPTEFQKFDFMIHLTQKEPFWWNTSRLYNQVDADGYRTQIPAFDTRKGFFFACAVDDDAHRREIEWDFLQGSAIVLQGARSFQYNAIPHQGIEVAGDGVLNLDGSEYTMATSQVCVNGFADGWRNNAHGTWVVCSLEIDYVISSQPEFDINLSVWNQDEVFQSRHVCFYQFQQYDLKSDLQLDMAAVFTPKFQFSSTSTHAVWSVFYQTLGQYCGGGNVVQHPDTAVPAVVVLPPVPIEE